MNQYLLIALSFLQCVIAMQAIAEAPMVRIDAAHLQKESPFQ